jgi:hypothetical protein
MNLRKAMRYRMVRICDQRRTASEAQPGVKHHICTLDSAHDVARDKRRPPCQGREPRSRGLNLRDCAHSRRMAIRSAVALGPTLRVRHDARRVTDWAGNACHPRDGSAWGTREGQRTILVRLDASRTRRHLHVLAHRFGARTVEFATWSIPVGNWQFQCNRLISPVTIAPLRDSHPAHVSVQAQTLSLVPFTFGHDSIIKCNIAGAMPQFSNLKGSGCLICDI